MTQMTSKETIINEIAERTVHIQAAAKLLKTETATLRVRRVTWPGRNKVQAAYRKLMGREDFRRSIEGSRPDVEECHLIFTPHLPGEKCLNWWVYPYSHNWENQPVGTWEITGEPFYGIDPGSGGIAFYVDERGDWTDCGYDEADLRRSRGSSR